MYNIMKKFKLSVGTLGVEITDRYIKLAEIIPNRNNTFTLQKFLVELLPDDAVNDGRIKDPLRIIHILQNMITKMNIKSKNVHIVLPSHSIMVRFLKLPDIPRKDLRKLVDFEVKHNIHLPFEAPIYDFIKLNENPVEKKGIKKKKKAKNNQLAASQTEAAATSDIDRLFAEESIDQEKDQLKLQCDVMLVAAPQELISEYEEIFSATSLKLLSMEFKALSLFRLIDTTGLTDSKSTLMTIDINDHITDASIFYEKQLKITRTYPMNFAVKSPDSKDSSAMFLQFDKDDDSDFLNMCNDLGYELERLMNFYRYTLNNRDQEFSDILVTGDIQRISEIVEILNERLTVNVSLMFSQQIQSVHPQFSEFFSSIAVPMGLALRGNNR